MNKINLLKTTVIVSTVALLSACSSTFVDYNDMMEKKVYSNDKNGKLAYEYKKMAVYEHDEMYDFPDSYTWAKKSNMISEGHNPGPEDVADWNIKDDNTKHELYKEGNDLRVALKSQFAHERENSAIKAQSHYDCWIEQQEENWQTDEIAACKEMFKKALMNIENPREKGQTIYPEDMTTKIIVPSTVFFDYDKADLKPAAKIVLWDFVKQLKEKGLTHSAIVVDGFTDTKGNMEYNKMLSKKRAETVKHGLVSYGLHEKQIVTKGSGEEHLLVRTSDEVDNYTNRRVEITIYPHITFSGHK